MIALRWLSDSYALALRRLHVIFIAALQRLQCDSMAAASRRLDGTTSLWISSGFAVVFRLLRVAKWWLHGPVVVTPWRLHGSSKVLPQRLLCSSVYDEFKFRQEMKVHWLTARFRNFCSYFKFIWFLFIRYIRIIGAKTPTILLTNISNRNSFLAWFNRAILLSGFRV